MMLRLVLAFNLLMSVSVAHAGVVVSGTLQKWQPLTLDVDEPSLATDESADNPNPFLDMALTVAFTAPSGEEYTVPGFYAGDGNGKGEGSVWRVRFAPGETGEWNYRVAFRQGNELAIADDPTGGNALPSDGSSGVFTVSGIPADAQGFTRLGRLEYNGHHYLKFADGPYWIKGGVDSPENFFGFAGFDNTLDLSGGVSSEGLTLGVHRYEEHVADWREGDPEFSNIATGFSGRAIIGAVNYLADQGVNSLYFLPMNLGGDGRETYPFLGTSGSRDDNTHYDVSKLYQWNQVLNHMQNRGVAAHLVLAETEGGNTNWLDNGQLGDERKLYYRELVARYSYLLALKWNLSEESRYGDSRHREFARYIRSIDWAQHQVAVHTNRDRADERYDGLLGNMDFDATSIQYSPEQAEANVETWRRLSAEAGWPWVIDMDENSPAGEGLTDTNAQDLRRSVLYPVYFSGGNLEWYFGYHDLPLGGDIRTENFRTRETMFRYMRYAREFMENNLPFHEMEPSDSLHSESGQSDIQVFAKVGEAYAVYLSEGNVGGELTVPEGDWDLRWFNPREGEFVGETQQFTGNRINQGTPPDSVNNDWVLLVKPTGELPSPEPFPEPEPNDSGDEVADGGDETGAENPDTTTASGAGEGNAPDVETAQEASQSGGNEPDLGAAVGASGVTGGAINFGWMLVLMVLGWRRILRVRLGV